MAQPTPIDLTCEALSSVLDVPAENLRSDTPLADIGADSIVVVMVADIVDRIDSPSVTIDNERLRLATTVGELATAFAMARS